MTYDRRRFIKTSAAAAAAVAVMPSCVSNSSSAQNFNVGVQLYTVRDEMAKDPVGTLEKISKIGFTKIETAGYTNGQTYGFTGTDFKQILKKFGLEYVSGHLSPDVFANSFDQALSFMEAAGQQYAVFPWLAPEQRVSIDQYKQYAQTLNKCGEMAKEAGITIAYHNHEFEFDMLDGQMPMDVLLSETDPDLVKIELDLYWVHFANVDPFEFLSKNTGRVELWHVKDMDDTPEKSFTEVGNGVIDYATIFEQKKVSGMKHYFIEQDQSDNPLQSLEISYKNLTQNILA